MTRRLRRLAIGLVVAVVAVASTVVALSAGGGSGNRLTAYFAEAVDLYPGSAVKLMGFDVGKVDHVTVDGSRVRVDMTIDGNVPIPRSVTATIDALTIIGERNVVLAPPWKPGQAKAPDGFVIPEGHTVTPVEVDDALKEIKNLADSLDPEVVAGLIDNAATALAGTGTSFNDLVSSGGTIAGELGQEDQQLLQTAQNLDVLSQTVNGNQQALGSVIDDFSQTAATLAAERQAISSLLAGANHLVNVGSALLGDYSGTLPTDIAQLTELGQTLEANVGVLSGLIQSFPKVAQGLIDAYDPQTGELRLGAGLTPTIESTLGTVFNDILQKLGVGPGG